jgi:hypothetical protein
MYDRYVAALVGVNSLIVPMQILGKLQNAVDTCSICTIARCESFISYYNAVAYYTGSLERTSLFDDGSSLQAVFDADGSETSLYNLADHFCNFFGTCASSGTANVNLDIFQALDLMRHRLIGSCSDALVQKEIVVKKIFVVLIQNLFYLLNDSFIEQPNGPLIAGFAAALSVLPTVHFCNATSANTILQNFQTGSPSYSIVKAAMEETYDCLGITADEVGVYKATSQ